MYWVIPQRKDYPFLSNRKWRQLYGRAITALMASVNGFGVFTDASGGAVYAEQEFTKMKIGDPIVVDTGSI